MVRRLSRRIAVFVFIAVVLVTGLLVFPASAVPGEGGTEVGLERSSLSGHEHTGPDQTVTASAGSQSFEAEPFSVNGIEIVDIDGPAKHHFEETLEITVTVQNNYDDDVEDSPISLYHTNDDEIVDTAEVDIASGETTDVTLTWEPSQYDIGDVIQFTINTGADQEYYAVQIASHAFEFYYDVVYQHGNTVWWEAGVENGGILAGEETIQFQVNGFTVESETLSLDAGETDVVYIGWEGDLADEGNNMISLAMRTDMVSQFYDYEKYEFHIDSVDTGSEPRVGETHDVTVDVENPGSKSGDQEIALIHDGEAVDSEELHLNGGDDGSVTLAWTPTAEDHGTQTLTVETEDDTESVDVDVGGDAQFDVDITGTTDPVYDGQSLDVTATIANNGYDTDDQSVEFTVSDGSKEIHSEERSVELGSKVATTETFSWAVDDAVEFGEYTVTVSSDDDSDSTAISVTDVPQVQIDSLETTAFYPVLEWQASISDVETESADEGTESDPYVIETAEDLQNINDDLDAHYVLANDIDAGHIDDFETIGDYQSLFNWDMNKDTFTGTIDGQGYTISNVSIETPTEDGFDEYIGLIEYNEGTVTNLTVQDMRIETGDGEYVGGIAGRNDGSIARTAVTGTIGSSNTEARSIGGLVGDDRGEITESAAFVSVEGNRNIGGLVGAKRSGSISNSYAAGHVSGNTKAGGFAGWVSGSTISNSYSTAAVSVGSEPGGFVGDKQHSWEVNPAEIIDSYWDIEASGKTSSDGGTGLETDEMTGEGAIEAMEGLDFSVDGPWEIRDEIPSGETLTFVTVLSGAELDEERTESVSLRVDGEEQESSTVTVQPGGTATATFDVDTTDYEPNTYEFSVVSDGDGESVTIPIKEQSAIEASGHVVPKYALTGGSLVTSVDVTNHGGDGSTTLTLEVDGEKRDTVEVVLGEQESTTMTLEWEDVDLETGEYDVQITGAGMTHWTTVNVTESIFDIESVDIDEEVVAGEPLSMNATITNDLDSTETQSVAAMVNGTVVNYRAESIDPGASKELEFEWTPTEDETGTVTVGIVVAGKTETRNVTVLEPAAYEFSLESITDPVDAGESVEIVVNATNVGEAPGVKPMSIVRSGETLVLDVEALDLAPSESGLITMEWETDADDVGTHNLTIWGLSDKINTTVTVDEAPDDSSDDGSVAPVGGGGGGGGGFSGGGTGTIGGSGGPSDSTTEPEDTSVDITRSTHVSGTDRTTSTTTSISTSSPDESVRVADADGEPLASAGNFSLDALEITSSSAGEASVSTRVLESPDETETPELESEIDGVSASTYFEIAHDFGENITSATISTTVTSDEIDDPANASIYHYTGEQWRVLETEYSVVSDDEDATSSAESVYRLNASTDSFSTFAVGVTSDEPTQEPVADDVSEDTDEPSYDDDDDPESGVSAFAIAVLVLLALFYVAVGVGVYNIHYRPE